MPDPGVIGSQVPPGTDEIWKQLKDLQQQTQQALAFSASAQAVAGSLTAVLANQVLPAGGSSSGSGFTLNTTSTARATVTITVPAGYTKAAVFASGTLTSLTAASGDNLYVRTVIAGNLGIENRGFMTVSYPYSGLAAFSQLNMAGLAAGSTFDVSINGRLSTGPGDPSLALANVTAMALFQK